MSRMSKEGAMAIRILVVDDHGVVREGLRLYLSSAPGLEVVGEATNGEEALRLVRELRPDVVLMDLIMPVMDGIAATEAIRAELPEVEVIALTSVLGSGSVSGAIKAGANGYLLKDTDAEELQRAIRAAAEGKVHLTPEAAALLAREVRAPESPAELTDRETEVLKLVARGWTNKQIASELFVGDKTVKAHLSSILKKLGVQSRTHAALHAVRTGLVSIDELNEEAW